MQIINRSNTSPKSASAEILERLTKGGPQCMASLRSASKPNAEQLGEWQRKFKYQIHQDPQLEEALTLSVRFCRAYAAGNGPYMLSLIGASGTGKTHLARQIWERRYAGPLSEGWSRCEYTESVIHWPTLIGDVKGSQNYGMLRDLVNWPLLIIDEAFGDKDPSGFSTSELVVLLTRREFKHTVITSNLTIQEIADIETRIASRMARSGNVFAQMTTIDYSMRKV